MDTGISNQVNNTATAVASIESSKGIDKSTRSSDLKNSNVSVSKTQTDVSLDRLKDVSMEIDVDDNSGLPVVKLRSNASGEVVMQIPAEYSLRIRDQINVALGSIVDKRS